MGHDVARARRLVLGASLLALASCVTVSKRAAADEKQACVAASEKAQQLRSAGKLGEARDQLNICGRAECPKLIQQDCTQWMSEVLASLPSVVPGAKDARGRDLVDVRLTIDGKVATDRLDGKAIVLDPGVHAFVFERFERKGAAGSAAPVTSVNEQVVVRPGEKNRIVTVTLTGPDDAASAGIGPSTSGARTGAPPDEPRGSSPPIAAYVLGGLGLAALGAALYFDLTASSDARGLRRTCAPNCNQADVDDVQSKYTLAGITAGIGGALVVTGVVLFILHGKGSARAGALGPSTALLRF
jgi:hypothetical protein